MGFDLDPHINLNVDLNPADLVNDVAHAVESGVSQVVNDIKDPGAFLADVAKQAGDGIIHAVIDGVIHEAVAIGGYIVSDVAATVSLVPGIGTVVSVALEAGWEAIKTGKPIDVAIEAAYAAIPIPPGLKNVTDIVLDAILALVDNLPNLSDAVVKVARDQVPDGLPKQVFDTLISMIVQKKPRFASGSPVDAALHGAYGFDGSFPLTHVYGCLLHGSTQPQLQAAFKADWTQYNGDRTRALGMNDYRIAWNIVSNNGHTTIAPPRPSRVPHWDGTKLVAAVKAGKADANDTAATLYAYGWYPEGDTVRKLGLNQLANSPVGALLAATAAIGIGDPARMIHLANKLDEAAKQSAIIEYWKTRDWGYPATNFGTVAQGLRTHAKTAMLALAAKANAAQKKAADARAKIATANLNAVGVQRRAAANLAALDAQRQLAASRQKQQSPTKTSRIASVGATLAGGAIGSFAFPVGTIVGLAIGGAIDIIRRKRRQ